MHGLHESQLKAQLGAAHDGTGAQHDGAAQLGAAHDGAAQDGASHDGAAAVQQPLPLLLLNSRASSSAPKLWQHMAVLSKSALKTMFHFIEERLLYTKGRSRIAIGLRGGGSWTARETSVAQQLDFGQGGSTGDRSPLRLPGEPILGSTKPIRGDASYLSSTRRSTIENAPGN